MGFYRGFGATLAALCANFVGIGLARFGYTPLIPALVAAAWFTPSEAVYLGAANLAGYLAGALGARRIEEWVGARAVLRGAMLLTAVSLFACALAWGFWWFLFWRFISGGTGGVLMALAAPAVLPGVAPARRGLAGGIIFTGVGLGIAASGTLVPLLMRAGLIETWCGLGAAALVLTIAAWCGWPQASAAQPAPEHQPAPAGPALAALYVEYALNAVGLVPHMVFLVDYVARALGQGLEIGARYWILFGIGAVCGPVLGGALGDRLGFRAALRLAFVIQAIAIGVPLVVMPGLALQVSSLVVGAFVPGVVAITIGRTRELLPGDPSGQTTAWSRCTTAFAIGQAVAGYGFSFLFANTANGSPLLFALATAALLLALGIDIAVGITTPRRAIP